MSSSYNLTEEQRDMAKQNYIVEQSSIYEHWNPFDVFELSEPILKNGTPFKKVIIEIGSGNGNFLIHLAENNPDNFYIGIEMRRKRILQCAFKSYKRKLKNIGFIYGDAKIILISKKIREKSVDEYYLTFPDPWPKKRHKRNRIVNNDFVEMLHKSLVKNGIFTIATDNSDYLNEIIETLDYSGNFKYLLENRVSSNLDNFYQSYFEKLWREQGREIYYCIVRSC